MNVSNEYFSVARGGTFTVNTTTEAEGNFHGLYVPNEATIDSLKVNGVDVKAEYIQDAAVALEGGTLITCLGDDHFSAVKLLTGQVTLIRKA